MIGTLPYFQHFYIGKQFSGGGGGGVPFASPEAEDIPNKGLTLKEFSPSGANSFFLELIPLRWETKIAVASRERVYPFTL